MSRHTIDILHHLNQILLIPQPNLTKRFLQIKNQIAAQHLQHLFHALRLTQKFLHIKLDHIILIPMCRIRSTIRNFQLPKQRIRIHPSLIIRCQHIRRHRLTKPSRTAHADKPLHRPDTSICHFKQSALIHKNLRIQRNLKQPIPRIQIRPHEPFLLSS